MRAKVIFTISLCVLLSITSCGGSEESSSAKRPENINAPISKKEEESYNASENTIPEYFPWNCEDFSISAGTNIGLFYTWLTMTEKQNEEYFDVVDHKVFVNGVPINPVMEGTDGIEETSDGNFTQLYWVDIGNYPAGTYTLRNVIEVNEKVFDGWDWYGPDSDYPTMESGCTVTVTAGGAASSGSGSEAPAMVSSCDIDSPIREDWPAALCETFDSSTVLWVGNSQGVTASVQSGEYIIDNTTGVSQGYTTGYTFPVFAGSGKDHMISVDAELESVFRDCTWGVFVRSTMNEIVYFFMINSQGRYSLTGSTENEAARYLGNIDSGTHKAIVWDGANNITAVAEGKQLEFYVNDQLVVRHEANNDFDDQFGLIVWGGEGVTALTKFDNLLVRVK